MCSTLGVIVTLILISRSVTTRAGSYVIRATVGGHNVPGWPQPLHVEAGLSDAAQCWLTGPPLQVTVCLSCKPTDLRRSVSDWLWQQMSCW
jgi:hypothetical protein